MKDTLFSVVPKDTELASPVMDTESIGNERCSVVKTVNGAFSKDEKDAEERRHIVSCSDVKTNDGGEVSARHEVLPRLAFLRLLLPIFRFITHWECKMLVDLPYEGFRA